jgi:hypothetical protein
MSHKFVDKATTYHPPQNTRRPSLNGKNVLTTIHGAYKGSNNRFTGDRQLGGRRTRHRPFLYAHRGRLLIVRPLREQPDPEAEVKTQIWAVVYVGVLAGCAAVELESGVQQVKIVTYEPQGCEYLGEVTGSQGGSLRVRSRGTPT